MRTKKLMTSTALGLMGLGVSFGVVACSTDNAATSGGAQTSTADTNAAQWVTQEAEDGTTMAVDQADNLKDGQKLEVKITQADPDMGYYLAVCAQQKTGMVPNCMGSHADTETQKWISNKNEEGAIPEDGTVETTLTVHPTGQDMNGQTLDCTTSQCVLKLFGDHSNGFIDIIDIPLTYAA